MRANKSKPEVHKVSVRSKMRTEPRTHNYGIHRLVKFGRFLRYASIVETIVLVRVKV